MTLNCGDLIFFNTWTGFAILKITKNRDGTFYEVKVVDSHSKQDIGMVDILDWAEIRMMIQDGGCIVQTADEKRLLGMLYEV